MRRTAGLAVAIGVLALAASEASAESWYFRWSCAGACAPDTLTVEGVDGPYPAESDCGHAQKVRRRDINGPGSAGWASSCFTSDGATAAGTIDGSAPVKPARLARVYLSVLHGAPWTINYADGTTADSGATSGGLLNLAFGHEVFGLSLSLGATRAPGTSPVATDAGEPWWFYDLQLGLHSSPFAIVRRPGLEVRPDLGVGVLDLGRVGCERCEYDSSDIFYEPEASSGFGVRATAGVDVWLGRRRKHGIAIEGVYQRLTMSGEAELGDPMNNVSAELVAPVWMARLSYVVRGSDFAAY